jgi:DNA-binding NarL/FixJ family response regulator
MTHRFLVVDDHPLFRDALQSAIALAYADAEVFEATHIDAAADMISGEKSGFDLVLLDLSMPGTTGFDGLLSIRTQFPKQPVVIVSGMDDPRMVREALGYGVAGFIPKSTRKQELARAITEVINGSIYVPPAYAAASVPTERRTAASDIGQRLATLTPQQLRVLQMLRQGLLNKQIAYELDVGETTVKAHVSEILRKLNVCSRTQAVIEASKIDFEQIAGDLAVEHRA